MRRSFAALLVAGLLLTAACGGDDEESGDGGDDPATSQGAEGAAGGSAEGHEFCNAYMELAGQAVETGADANAAAEQLQELEAPEEIADAWRVVLESGGQQGQMTPEVQQAATEVGQYVAQECAGTQMDAPPVSEGGATDATETPTTAG